MNDTLSTSLPTSTPGKTSGGEAKSSSFRKTWPNWLREPLLHFLVLGGLLFVANHFISGRADDPRVIVVGAQVDDDARRVFMDSRGREPNAEEMRALRQIWLDNEVLYREGLAMRVDKGDTAIRERVIFKALSIVDANVKLPTYDDKLLRGWFEQHRAKYDEPARYDFQEAILAGENTEPAMRAFVAALNAGTPGEAKAGLRVFKSRPQANIVQSYGDEFAKALQHVHSNEWQALRTRDGWRAIRLDAITPAKPADFTTLRGIVLQDWTDATMAEQRTAAVRALAGKYIVKTEAADK